MRRRLFLLVLLGVVVLVQAVRLFERRKAPPPVAPNPSTVDGKDPRRAEIARRLDQLLPRVSSGLSSLILDSIQLQETDGSLPIGASRVGGAPDLPPSTSWPLGEKGPLAFLAQIRLDEIALIDREQLLPHEGTLYFFYDAVEQPWGFRPSDRSGWRVWFDATAPSRLVRSELPSGLPVEAHFHPRALRPASELTLPPDDSPAVAALSLTADERQAYLGLAEELEAHSKPPLHRVLGHPDQIQNDMQLEAQLVSHGLYTGDASGYKDPRARALAPGALEWRLLLQIDSSDGAGMMWGDEGRVYFWIPRESLKARRFEDVWAILQCG